MKLDDIMKLINAGYTKEEIQALEGGAQAQEDVQENVQDEMQEDVQENVQDETQHASIDEAMNNALEQINKSVDAFTKKLQSFNLANAEMENVKTRSDEDIIASIVAPIKKGEK